MDYLTGAFIVLLLIILFAAWALGDNFGPD